MSEAVDPAALDWLSAVEHALARAETVPQALAIKASAEAARVYARDARLGLAATNNACLVRLHAEAKAADLLEQLRVRGEIYGRGGRATQMLQGATIGLADLAIERTEAHRWARVAQTTAAQRTAYAREATAGGEEVTRAGLVQWATRGRPAPVRMDPPAGTYRCLVIDPPWPVEKIERLVHPEQGDSLDYPTLPITGGAGDQDIEHVAAVPQLGDPAGCHVYLWTTQRFLHDALHLFEAWGVRYQCQLTWVKPSGFTPYSWMYDTEHVLFGTFGQALPLERLGLKLSFDAPVTRHSAKPDVFYERVVAASPGPRLELFARTPRDGFTVWGNEVAAVDGGEA